MSGLERTLAIKHHQLPRLGRGFSYDENSPLINLVRDRAIPLTPNRLAEDSSYVPVSALSVMTDPDRSLVLTGRFQQGDITGYVDVSAFIETQLGVRDMNAIVGEVIKRDFRRYDLQPGDYRLRLLGIYNDEIGELSHGRHLYLVYQAALWNSLLPTLPKSNDGRACFIANSAEVSNRSKFLNRQSNAIIPILVRAGLLNVPFSSLSSSPKLDTEVAQKSDNILSLPGVH